jgi:adenylate cyclase
MAMFGPPVARRHRHEIKADATAAVRFAIEMRRALRALNARFRTEGLPEMRVGVGIHSGELVSCSLGSADRQQYATIGDTTNVAARIMAVAKDRLRENVTMGTCCIVISDSTRSLLDQSSDLISLGPIMFKGKDQPVNCYVLAADHDPTSSTEASSSLLSDQRDST